MKFTYFQWIQFRWFFCFIKRNRKKTKQKDNNWRSTREKEQKENNFNFFFDKDSIQMTHFIRIQFERKPILEPTKKRVWVVVLAMKQTPTGFWFFIQSTRLFTLMVLSDSNTNAFRFCQYFITILFRLQTIPVLRQLLCDFMNFLW